MFGLKKKVLEAVQSMLVKHKKDLDAVVSSMGKDIAANAKQIDMINASLSKRLAFIEHHFAEELAAKEKARQESVNAIRVGHNK